MFAGLVLTSISTVMLRAALFQRKSRSGWLEELDGIRQEALDEPGAGADVVDASGIWTDLRDGGEYEDPHEISSLYATDATPDLPVTPPAPKATPSRARNKAKAKTAPEGADLPAPQAPTSIIDAPVAAAVEDALAPAASAGTLLPPPPVPAAPEAPEVTEPEPIFGTADDGRFAAAGAPLPPAAQYDDQIWVEPAPHPIRPSEMWHPAELAPVPLGEESYEPVAEERVASADLMDPTYAAPHAAAPVAPADVPIAQAAAAIDERVAAAFASKPVQAAAPAASAAATGGLVNGPVGRRVRRDRPAERPKASLPIAEEQQPLEPRGEQSPLPTQPLPPAALPTRANRLPGVELPATPSSVVAPSPASPAVTPRTIAPMPVEPRSSAMPAPTEAAPFPPAVAPAPVEPVAARPVADPASAIAPAEPTVAPAPVEPAVAAPAPTVAEPAAVAEPVAVAAAPEPEPAPIAIGTDGLVHAPGTIVRIGGSRRARATGTPAGVVVSLDEGWCWASPGEGAAAALRVDMVAGSLTVQPGATALAVVEADGSVFIVVAAGDAHLERDGDRAPIARGTIVMIDPSGAAQSDSATDAEIESDPIVAENLALDAEL